MEKDGREKDEAMDSEDVITTCLVRIFISNLIVEPRFVCFRTPRVAQLAAMAVFFFKRRLVLATETGNFDSHMQLSYSSYASPKPFSPVSQHPAVNGDSIGLAVHVLVCDGLCMLWY